MWGLKRRPIPETDADKALQELADSERRWQEFRVSREPTLAKIARHVDENHVYEAVVRTIVEGRI